MSLSSYFKRHSRSLRKSTVSAFGLASILEEDTESKTSVKAKRRQGVSNLCIPPLSPIGAAVQSDDESESSSASSSSSSDSSCGLPTTPSPTETSFVAAHEAQAVIRCKSIKPLVVSKRSVSPVPTLSSEEEDDLYYAAHAGGYITLAPHHSPVSRRNSHRESAVIPSSVSIVLPAPSAQLDPAYPARRRYSIPTRPPPPPPVEAEIPNFSRPTAALARPPPRTPIPMDAWSGDYTDVATFVSSPSSSRTGSSSPFSFTSPDSTSSSSSTISLDALLSPPSKDCETQFVPSDVDGEWEECPLEDDVYEDVPLSPLAAAPNPFVHVLAMSPPPATTWDSQPSPLELPSPMPLPSPRPTPRPQSQHRSQQQLRSRWSSSTLSSVHSSHVRAATSPKTFAFARRVRAMGMGLNLKTSTSAPIPSPKRRPGKGKKRLTAKDVRVMRPGVEVDINTTPTSPPAPPVPPKSAIPPLSLPKTPASAAHVQWASYPTSPLPAPYIRTPGPGLQRRPSQQSKTDALYMAYTTQRSPRRRVSTSSAKSASAWSFSTDGAGGMMSSASSEAGSAVEWSSVTSEASFGSVSGLRRKPIPVEMFLR